MSKLFKKTLLMMILAFGVIATMISGYAGWMLYNRIIDEYKSKGIAIANNIAGSSIEIFLNRDASTIQSIVDQYHEIGGVSYVLVVHPDGQILSHTFAPEVPYEMQFMRPRENKEQAIVSTIHVKGVGNFLDVSSPILSGVAGYVHVGMNLDGVKSYIWWQLIARLHGVTFVIFLISVAIAFVLTNTISRPLKELTDYANKVANRDFSAVVDIKSKDEIGVLAGTMTNMAAEIQVRMATLEQEVADATQELEETLAYVSAIIENLSDGLLVLEADGRISRSNPALSTILEFDYDPCGRSPRELLGREAADFLEQKGRELAEFFQLSPDGTEPDNAAHHLLLEKQRPNNTAEFTAVRRDGGHFPIELSVSVVNIKGVWHTIGIVRDITVRKRAEEALRMSEEKYRGIFEHAVDGIFQTDDRGRMVSANPASAQILGYGSPEELIEDAKRLGDHIYVNPRDREEFIRLMKSGQVVHGFEVQLFRKDGATIWTSLHARPIHDENGELLFTEGIIEDITERKRAQEALLESERRYRELFDTSPDPMVVHRDGRILFGNAAAAKFFRVGHADQLTGLSILDFVHADFRQVVFQRIDKAQHGGVASDFAEIPFRRADGGTGYLESIAVPTKYKGEKAVLALGRDITERKDAEEALRASEERFRTIFEVAPDCIFLKDRDLKYTDVNPAVETLLGVTAADIIGKKAEDFFGEEAARHIREGDLRVLAGETVDEEHTRPVRGMDLTFHDIRTPLRNSSGAVVGVCKFSRNITDRRGVQRSSNMIEREFKSKAMIATLERARHGAQTDGIILLLGESGSGKDYMARWIHSKSKRTDGPFFSVNCAAVPRELAESEFFGHERGAFTGALNRKRGLLELAEGGSLLLNEIGELPLNLQAKLLTFLDTRSFTRVGGEKPIHVNARLIAATHRDLELEVADGRFLEALYYRLNVYAITVPALRERLEDIPMIVEEILLHLATEMRLTQVPAIDQRDLRKLYEYRWPGNVRELRNVLERAVMLCREGGKLNLALPSLDDNGTIQNEWMYQVRFPDKQQLPDIINDVTRTLCAEALRRTGGSRKEAADLLGISRQSLYRYMKNFGMGSEIATTG